MDFDEKLGFGAFAGDPARNAVILEDGDAVIGLFQGMFQRNMPTFNPGWDGSAGALPSLMDVRELQRRLRAQGVRLETEPDEGTTGPGYFIAVDPDGNPILVGQHV